MSGTKRKRDSVKNTSSKKSKKSTSMKSLKNLVTKTILSKMELKYWEQYSTPAGVDFSGTVWPLSDITAGTADTNRIGDKAKPHNFTMKFNLVGADATNLMTVMVVRWKPDSQIENLANVSQVLGLTGSTLGPLSPPIWDTRQKFDILWGKRYSLALSGPQQIEDEVFLNLDKGPSIAYKATTTNGLNKLFLLAISDSGAVSHPTIQFYCRLSFYDA